jgi:5'-nucleotidase/UDP-sugar diphosphatase
MFSFSPERDDYPMATTAADGTLHGGFARRATLIAKEREAAQAAGKDVLLVSAGDNHMGTLSTLAFQTESIDYGVMKALGYDATTIGNHELDFGPKALAQAIASAAQAEGLPPIVASNIHFSDTDAGDDDLAALYGPNLSDDKPIHRYLVLNTPGGLKVGVIGYVGVNASHVAPNKAPVSFSAPVDPKHDGDPDVNLPAVYADLQPVVDTLRNDEHVDLVIGLGHAGVNDPTTPEGIAAGEDTRICENVSGIDVIISGHRHRHDVQPLKMTNTATQRPCVVLNAGSYGLELGRVDLSIPADPSQPVAFDEATHTLEPINDTIVPDPAIASKTESWVARIEAAGTQGSTLAQMLSHAAGATIVDDPASVGDLYFRKLTTTDFDVTDVHAVLWLAADAMLSQTDVLASAGVVPQTDIAVESAGVVRAGLLKGKTGEISVADAFNVVPLGVSPANGTAGYPLVRAYVSLLEFRAVVEFSLALSATNDDFDLGFSGIKVEFDKSRPAAEKLVDIFDPSKGQVMRISLDTDHSNGLDQYDQVLYDRAASIGDDGRLLSVVTSSYIAQFAGDAGAKLKNEQGQKTPIIDLILHRTGAGGDGSEVKEVEAFMRFLLASPGGKLPATYDVSSPSFGQRWVCVGGC